MTMPKSKCVSTKRKPRPRISRKKGEAMILKCICRHSFQDEQYGDGMRVHNLCKGPAGTRIVRCTVCGRTIDAKGALGAILRELKTH